MPEQRGIAGKSARDMADKRRKTIRWIAFGLLIATVIGFALIMKSKELGLGGGVAIGILFLLSILPNLLDRPIRRKEKEVRRADRGAAGEEKVAAILSALGSDFFILHDISSPYGNIDHIVIGRETGVFLLETKAHGGKITLLPDGLLVNGKPPEKDFINQAWKNAYWLRGVIEEVTGTQPRINALVVFTNAFVPSGQPIKGVQVINKRYLIDRLQRAGRSVQPVVWEQRQLISKRLMH
ncbi:MAG TPA: nuclease-related domain-containing protein [Anaerolineaceae bacterium]|mgnify:FL=1|nr:nuclease-related domain-containing protein [Anaerolineaceae bacterium]